MEEPKVIHKYFALSNSVRASHKLHEDMISCPQGKGLSKFVFYLILDKEMGRPHGKDAGLYGYKLEFKGFRFEGWFDPDLSWFQKANHEHVVPPFDGDVSDHSLFTHFPDHLDKDA